MTSFRIGQEVEVTRTYFSLDWQPNGECRRRPYRAETLVARVVKKIDGNPLVAWKSPTGVDEDDETEENDVDARAIFVFLFDAKSGKVLAFSGCDAPHNLDYPADSVVSRGHTLTLAGQGLPVVPR